MKGREGVGAILARMNLFFLLKVQDIFLQLQPFTRIFLNLLLTIFACPWRAFALGLYAVIFPRLVRRSRESDSKVLTLTPAPRSLRDSLQLSACCDAVLHTAAVWAVDCPFRQHGQPISLLLSVRGCVHRMLVR